MRLFRLLLLSALIGGCGSSSVNPGTSASLQGSPQSSLRLRLVHDLEVESGPGSGLPEDLDFWRIVALDADGRVLNETKPTQEAGELLLQIDGRATSLLIEYSRTAGGPVIGSSRTPLLPGVSEYTLELVGDPTSPVRFVRVTDGQRNRAVINGHQLLIDGQPVFLRGAGYDYTLEADANFGTWFSYLNDVSKAGGNCLRVYGIPWVFADVNKQAALLSAQLALAKQQNLYILAGVPWQPEAGDMDTLFPALVQKVQQDPNFDRLVGWCVGLEVPNNRWPALNNTIHKVQEVMVPSTMVRPVMTALPAVSSGAVSQIQRDLSDLDWLGINNFFGRYNAAFPGPGGFLPTQANDLSNGGWKLPWAVTEYYSYDIPTDLGIPSVTLNGHKVQLELNSTANAQNYTESLNLVKGFQGQGCVGGMALNWGPPHNSQIPAFFKQMYVYRGEFKPFVNPSWTGGAQFDRLACVDAVAAGYGGSVSSNACPAIQLPGDGDGQGITCTFKGTVVAPGASLTASVSATDSEPLSYDWYLIGGVPGDINGVQTDPTNYGGVFSKRVGTEAQVTFTAPPTRGNVYQLRVIVRDPSGGAATAVVPFAIQP